MTTQTRRRLLGGGAAAALTILLAYGYRSYAVRARFEEAKRLAALIEEAPRDQSEALRKDFRAKLAGLTPDQRREVFESGFDARIDAYFQKSPAERAAYLDELARRMRARRTAAGRTASARSKSAATARQVRPAGASQAGGGRNGGGGWGGRGGRTPEQRAQARRERLDRTSPESRAKRAEFFAALRARRGSSGRGR